MGAKQSKRSVDISGKEAESAGEVAVAGAGGEGRVEPIADDDALKPQLINGDVHIQPSQEITDKEKQLDSGTPENEKDATTEKERKEEQEDPKEATPVTNGENETKEENGDSVPTPEDGKKPKKEKVKKKWSLRSISFSRKDKPKQEKKLKEEEPKTNGEPEKVPEEAVEATTETVKTKIAEVVKPDEEAKEEKTPETPVTEPLTNGNSTPESPKVETPTIDEPVPASEADKPQEAPATETKPEQLPVNGLSLEEPKKDVPVVAAIEESKPEHSTACTTETVPVPEIPAKTEVCDAKMPLIEPTPPPLPANPPPSSVASFAATTMAPELIEASLVNTTENAIFTPPAFPDTKADRPDENETESQQTVITNTDIAVSQLSPPLKETVSEDIPVATATTEVEIKRANTHSVTDAVKYESEIETVMTEIKESKVDVLKTELENNVIEISNASDVRDSAAKVESALTTNANGSKTIESQSQVVDEVIKVVKNEICNEFCTVQNNEFPEPTSDIPDIIDELPLPPPPIIEDENNIQRAEKDIEACQTEIIEIALKDINLNTNDNIHDDMEKNGNIDETEQDKILNKKKKDALGNIIDTIECNGKDVSEEAAPASASEEVSAGAAACTPDDSLPPSLSEGSAASGGSAASDSLPPPPSDLSHALDDADERTLQEPLPIADKIADLIPEIPTVPELKTETETSSELAVAD